MLLTWSVAVPCPYLPNESLTTIFKPQVGSLHKFDDISVEYGPTMNFFIPPALDGRIKNQCSVFSVGSSPLSSADEILRRHPGCVRRLIIPSFLKGVLHDTLDFMGVHERMLFPGLEGLSAALTRYFTREPRPSPEDIRVLNQERWREDFVQYGPGAPLEPQREDLQLGHGSLVLVQHAENSVVSVAGEGGGVQGVVDTISVLQTDSPPLDDPPSDDPPLDDLMANSQPNRDPEPKRLEFVSALDSQSALLGETIQLTEEVLPKIPLRPAFGGPTASPHELDTESVIAASATPIQNESQRRELAVYLSAHQKCIEVQSLLEGSMLHNIEFEINSSKLLPSGEDICMQIVSVLHKYPDIVINVDNYSDCVKANCGEDCGMANLSQRRADSISAFLQKSGCKNIFHARGIGCKHPHAGQVWKIHIYPEDSYYEKQEMGPLYAIDSSILSHLAPVNSQPPIVPVKSDIADDHECEIPLYPPVDNNQPTAENNGVEAPASMRMLSLAFSGIDDDGSASIGGDI